MPLAFTTMTAGTERAEERGAVRRELPFSKTGHAHAVARQIGARNVAATERKRVERQRLDFVSRHRRRRHQRTSNDRRWRADVFGEPVRQGSITAHRTEIGATGILFTCHGQVRAIVAADAAHLVAPETTGGVKDTFRLDQPRRSDARAQKALDCGEVFIGDRAERDLPRSAPCRRCGIEMVRVPVRSIPADTNAREVRPLHAAFVGTKRSAAAVYTVAGEAVEPLEHRTRSIELVASRYFSRCVTRAAAGLAHARRQHRFRPEADVSMGIVLLCRTPLSAVADRAAKLRRVVHDRTMKRHAGAVDLLLARRHGHMARDTAVRHSERLVHHLPQLHRYRSFRSVSVRLDLPPLPEDVLLQGGCHEQCEDADARYEKQPLVLVHGLPQ
jgi:hypothetical protein